MPNPILEKEYDAGAAVTIYRIAKMGAADKAVILSAAETDLHVGVFQHTAASGARVRVMRVGITYVEAGGTFARGAKLTADSSGRAIVAAATHVVAGIAEVSAVVGDIGEMMVAPSTIF